MLVYKINNLNNNSSNENISINENEDSNLTTEDEDFNNKTAKNKVIKTTTASVVISMDYVSDTETKEIFAEISIEEGKLIVTTRRYIVGKEDRIIDNSYTPINKIFSIDGEKIKVMHHNYYQSGSINVIYYLTENGNIYVNEFKTYENTIDIINNFEKMNYSNVSELVMEVNDNFGQKLDSVSGMIDSRKQFIYAMVDKELLYLERQYMG